MMVIWFIRINYCNMKSLYLQQNPFLIKKKNDILRELCENIKDTNIHIIGVPEEEERKGSKCI